MAIPQLSGNVEILTDVRDTTISKQKARIRELEDELEALQRQEQLAHQAVLNLRRTLAPLYKGLQEVFGVIEPVVGVRPMDDETGAASRSNPRWEQWKKDLGGRSAQFIDLLLVHSNMSVKQLMAAAHCAKQTVYDTISKMLRAGILVNNGGRYSLKEN